jgi:hypothetical protein
MSEARLKIVKIVAEILTNILSIITVPSSASSFQQAQHGQQYLWSRSSRNSHALCCIVYCQISCLYPAMVKIVARVEPRVCTSSHTKGHNYLKKGDNRTRDNKDCSVLHTAHQPYYKHTLLKQSYNDNNTK